MKGGEIHNFVMVWMSVVASLCYCYTIGPTAFFISWLATFKLLLFAFRAALLPILAMVGSLARAALGVELEPQFDKSYLSTSLQDFWGRRWNLMASNILRPTVYDPVTSVSSRAIWRKWAPLPAVIAAFFVSGLMHELIFFYLGRSNPTWDLTCFFLLHGVCFGRRDRRREGG
ncbi:hypothetical protein TIFTF001_006048 [Ficus carica]|uniref:Wax synthase domain-containing protein n=1 Tax=Ficus carica TaxID=3494 RepID=A0AA88A3A5_FICCA|nr:hypothetical protein TIFTF001_006048 [Ficus carica]